MLVVFFDIDGTLLSTGGAGGTAMRLAFRNQFGVAEPANVPFSGRTDRAIGASFFAAHGIEDCEEHWRRFREAYLCELERQLPRHEGSVLPGIPELIAELASDTDVAVGLLTGNMEHGAWRKLEYYGLRDRFAFGGFGDVHHRREEVAEVAMETARHHLGRSIERAVVIGDTPLDVACARAVGADVIAVATGIHDWEELEASRPDLLLEDLSDWKRVCDFLRS